MLTYFEFKINSVWNITVLLKAFQSKMFFNLTISLYTNIKDESLYNNIVQWKFEVRQFWNLKFYGPVWTKGMISRSTGTRAPLCNIYPLTTWIQNHEVMVTKWLKAFRTTHTHTHTHNVILTFIRRLPNVMDVVYTLKQRFVCTGC